MLGRVNKYLSPRLRMGNTHCLSSASRGTFRFRIRAGRHSRPVRGARPLSTLRLRRLFLPCFVNGSKIFIYPNWFILIYNLFITLRIKSIRPHKKTSSRYYPEEVFNIQLSWSYDRRHLFDYISLFTVLLF